MFVNYDKNTFREIVCRPIVNLFVVAMDIPPLGLNVNSDKDNAVTPALGESLIL